MVESALHDSPLLDRLTALLYRVAVYVSTNVIDDAAMLAFMFC